jgi:hypothetical protein
MGKFQGRLPCRWPEPLYSANGPFCTESLPYPGNGHSYFALTVRLYRISVIGHDDLVIEILLTKWPNSDEALVDVRDFDDFPGRWIRIGISLVSYQASALMLSLVLLCFVWTPVCSAVPMILSGQTYAGTLWMSGVWLLAAAFPSSLQLRQLKKSDPGSNHRSLESGDTRMFREAIDAEGLVSAICCRTSA